MIEIEQLTVRFGSQVVVDDVSFVCRPGQVTGFLGPNGAGKTTTMRVLTGLTTATSGQALVGGRRYRELVNPARHVGVLLDASAQHGGRTGREILTLAAKTIGLAPQRAGAALERVGLTAAEGRRRLVHYSLGMRQRLGLAHALLGEPGVLVLDEPANGLDPAGIRWMRDLLSDYAADGGTVLLSSHLLREVEVVADTVVVIGRGKIVAQGSSEELTRSGTATCRVVAAQPEQLVQALRAGGHEVTRGSRFLEVDTDALTVGGIALQHRLLLSHLEDRRGTLEDLFLSLTATSPTPSQDLPAQHEPDHHDGAVR